jgi:outer membrane protein OmpA-like peptidoglycan-associated protein
VVFDYLDSKVESDLTYRGFGETKPLVPNESANGRMINRRTSFVIIQ